MAELLTNAAEYTVSEISQAVKRTVEDEFGHVRVRGEISGFRGQHASGHAYFTLKDENATIDAVVWKSSWPRLLFKPEEGLEVIATGRLTTFPKSSKYQIVIEQIEPAGAGALMVLLEERRKKLFAEGLFDKARKRALPYLPRIIGIITSPTGAVIRDILHRLDDRFPSHVLLWPVRVQGETCAPEVTAAIEGFNSFRADGPIPRPDLLIVARGGGSIEDLWGFNEEMVVRAVVASAIPIISAVGHETDTTLIDYAADMRAPTPTAAAEAAVPVRSELIACVDDLGHRTRNSIRRGVANDRDRLRAAAAGLPRPLDLVATARQRLDHAASNLLAALRHAGQRKTIDLGKVAPRLIPQLLRQRARELRARLLEGERRHDAALSRAVERRRAALAAVAAKLSPTALRGDLHHSRSRMAPLAARLAPAFGRLLEQRRERLSSLGKLLDSYSYKNVLDRGFALVTDAEGRIVRSREHVDPGDPLIIEVADGQIGATVSGAPVIRRKPRPPRESGEQESLF
ncbi:MAG: exodeoxyribonuclease VII large subunit [Devosia sp.]